MKKYDAVIAGYTCVDMFPNFNKSESKRTITDLLKPGKLIEIDDMNYVLGGVVPNTGLAMKKFNKKVFLNGLTGDDLNGKMVIEYLGKYNISEGIATIQDAGTAFSIVLATAGIDRIFLESPGCSRIFDISYINFDAVSQSSLFHFGYPPLLPKFFSNNGQQLSHMFSKVEQMGVVTSLDFSLPDPESVSGKINWPEIMRQTLPFVDIFLPSLEEALFVMMPGTYADFTDKSHNCNIINDIPESIIRELGKLIMDAGVKITMIKAGERGIYMQTGNVSSVNKKLDHILKEEAWNYFECWCNAYQADPLKINNTCGAGDTAAAAFLSAMLEGENPEPAIKYAAMAGRNNLYCSNMHSDLPDWQTMREEIKAEKNEIIYFADN